MRADLRRAEFKEGFKAVPLGLLFITILVTPGFNFDPYIMPKFFTLLILGFGLIAVILSKWLDFNLADKKIVILGFTTFLIALTPSTLFSNNGMIKQVYGEYARQAGALTQLTYLAILLFAVLLPVTSIRTAVNLFAVGGFANSFYATLQYFELDPVNWNKRSAGMAALQGNPNFYSSLSGVLTIILLDRIFLRKQGISIKTVYVSLVFFLTWLNLVSDSIQGIILTFIGFVAVLSRFLFKRSRRLFAHLFMLTSTALFIFISISVWGIGPLGSKLEQASLYYRRDYWLAGLKMFQQNIFTGVGLDGYGDWYHRTRSLSSTMQLGSSDWTNSPHSQIIEYLAFGGAFLGFAYAVLIIIITRGIVILIKSKSIDTDIFTIMLLFLALFVQSQISMHSVVLNSWMWFFAGIILNRARIISVKNRDESGLRNSASLIRKTEAPSRLMTPIFMIGAILGALIAMPAYIADTRFSQAIQSRDSKKIFVASVGPFSSDTHGQFASLLFTSSGQKENARRLLRQIHERNPDNVITLYLMLDFSPLGSKEYENIKRKILILDPLGRFSSKGS